MTLLMRPKKEIERKLDELYDQLVALRHKANGTLESRKAIAQVEGWAFALEWILGIRKELDGKTGNANGSGKDHLR